MEQDLRPGSKALSIAPHADDLDVRNKHWHAGNGPTFRPEFGSLETSVAI
jgi:hypothetical protein